VEEAVFAIVRLSTDTASSTDVRPNFTRSVPSLPLPCESCSVMAVALLGKCVTLLGLVVLFYATCYGFRIRDAVPQTYSAVCVPAHGRTCPADKTTTTATEGPMYLARKWHESAVLRTIATSRKPPAELTTAIRTERTRSEKNIKYERDKDATESMQRSSKTKVDDEEVIEVESSEEVGEDRRLMGDFHKEQMDRVEEYNKKREATEMISDQVDDDDDDDDEQKTKAAIKIDQRKVPDLQKKHDKTQNLRTDDKDEEIKDENEDKEDDVRKLNLLKKLEKVRLADKDKTKTSFSRHNVEKSKQEDRELTDTKPSTESVKKPIESTKQSIDVTKKSTDNTKKTVESDKKLPESTKKVESIKTTVKSKTEATKIATKPDEKPKTSVKLETSTLKIKEQSKQPEKADVKKVTKSISKPLKEISQVESEYYFI